MKKLSHAPYIFGFALSIALTLAAYALVEAHLMSGSLLFSPSTVVVFVMLLALAQLLVQLTCFLHLGERAARERLAMLGAALLVVGILVIGSLWIMQHLNTRMMADPAATQVYMDSQSGL